MSNDITNPEKIVVTFNALDRERLIRLDERTNTISVELLQVKDSLSKELMPRHEIERQLENAVTRAEFTPVKAIVYGMTGIFLTAICVALAAIVVTGNAS